MGHIKELRTLPDMPCRRRNRRLADAEAPRDEGFERTACLEQLLEAFIDIADRDDIHQAAQRLARVQEWISREAARAAADPIFDGVRLAS